MWYLLGDETTEDEGPNMQQIPREEQSLFLKLYSTMGQAYSLHTPWALPTALRRGLNTVDHPHRGGPFFLLMPMNVQPIALQQFNLDELPTGAPPALGAADETGGYERAADAIRAAERIVVRVGGGATGAGAEIQELLELVDGVAVVAPDRPRRRASSAPAQHDRRRLERLAQRQLRHGRSRPADRHRLKGGLPGRLLTHRLPARAARDQHQHRPARGHALRQDHRADR